MYNFFFEFPWQPLSIIELLHYTKELFQILTFFIFFIKVLKTFYHLIEIISDKWVNSNTKKHESWADDTLNVWDGIVVTKSNLWKRCKWVVCRNDLCFIWRHLNKTKENSKILFLVINFIHSLFCFGVWYLFRDDHDPYDTWEIDAA